MKLRKKFLACTMALLLCSPFMHAQASNIGSIQQQINQNKNELNKVNNQINKYEAERDEYLSMLDDQKSEMMNLMKDVVYYENAIEEKRQAISNATVDLEAAAQARDEQFEAMMVHIQYMYERGDDNYLILLLASNDFTDLINRAEYVDSLYQYDKAIFEEYALLVADIETMKNTLETEKIDLEKHQVALEGQKAELQRIMDDLKDKISDYDDLVAKAKSQAKEYQNKISQGQNKIEEIKKQEEEKKNQQNQQNNSSGNVTVSGTGTGAEIAEYALQYVGNPYVYGGSSLTNGADCSGFIMAVYLQFGYSLPHSSYSMRSIGTGVSLAEAQAGDIICYSGHVGLYIGNGQIVHAKNSKYGIVTDPVYYSGGGTGPTVLAVRRVIK